jgi:uridine kinase
VSTAADEPTATGPSTAGDIADALLSRAGRLDGTRLLCIDGPAGSGKTTLAGRVQFELCSRGLGVETLHMDDLYEGWSGLDTSLEQRLLDQVLHPLARSAPGCWQRYDWYSGRFGEWSELLAGDVLVIEGCGSGATAYSDYRSLLVWLEAPQELRLRRGVDRDGPEVLPHWLAWMDLERAYFAVNSTKESADIVLSSG